jgi:hypothetical protein
VEHVESDRLLTEVEERLWFDPNLLPPRVLEVPVPSANLGSVIGSVANRGKQRVELDLLIAQCNEGLRFLL